jgi:hypothetical protein
MFLIRKLRLDNRRLHPPNRKLRPSICSLRIKLSAASEGYAGMRKEGMPPASKMPQTGRYPLFLPAICHFCFFKSSSFQFFFVPLHLLTNV